MAFWRWTDAVSGAPYHPGFQTPTRNGRRREGGRDKERWLAQFGNAKLSSRNRWSINRCLRGFSRKSLLTDDLHGERRNNERGVLSRTKRTWPASLKQQGREQPPGSAPTAVPRPARRVAHAPVPVSQTANENGE